MAAEVRVFLDTSVLFAAVLSETGAARLVLKLGEAGAVRWWVGPQVLREADGVLSRKAPDSKALFALLLDRARVALGPPSDEATLARAGTVVDYLPDAHVVAEALAAHADYLVSLDRAHLVGNPRGTELPFTMGTPGDFLTWFRERWSRDG